MERSASQEQSGQANQTGGLWQASGVWLDRLSCGSRCAGAEILNKGVGQYPHLAQVPGLSRLLNERRKGEATATVPLGGSAQPLRRVRRSAGFLPGKFRGPASRASA